MKRLGRDGLVVNKIFEFDGNIGDIIIEVLEMPRMIGMTPDNRMRDLVQLIDTSIVLSLWNKYESAKKDYSINGNNNGFLEYMNNFRIKTKEMESSLNALMLYIKEYFNKYTSGKMRIAYKFIKDLHAEYVTNIVKLFKLSNSGTDVDPVTGRFSKKWCGFGNNGTDFFSLNRTESDLQQDLKNDVQLKILKQAGRQLLHLKEANEILRDM